MDLGIMRHTVEHVGERGYLLVAFGVGSALAWRLRKADRLISRLLLASFILLISSLIFRGFHLALKEAYTITTSNASPFSRYFSTTVCAGAAFFSELIGWVLVLVSLTKLVNRFPQETTRS